MRTALLYNRAMPLKINFKTVALYISYAAAAALINYALPDVPLSLGLCFSMLACGTNVIITPALYVIASAANLSLIYSVLALFDGAFLSVIVFLYRRSGRKLKFEAAVYLAIALAPYVIFSPWRGFGSMTDLNPYIIKAIAAAVAAAFAYFCFKTVYALLFRIYRCRLREDEIVCIAVVFTAAGAGLYSLAGQAFYLCFAAGAIAFFTRLARSPASVIAAMTLALPHALVELNLEPVTAYVIISTAALLFLNLGRFAPAVISGGLTAGYMYLTGCFDCPMPLIILFAFLLFMGCATASLPQTKKLENLKRRLECEQVLEQNAVTRSRRRTGERLYKISELFREIECAFLSLDDGANDSPARERMYLQLKERCCGTCERSKNCEKTAVYTGFRRLIDSGCLKGRVNLIDLPSEITTVCASPSIVMTELNSILNEYRKYMTEAENARSGRKLLADQAHGVAEVMKECAVELNRTTGQYRELETEVKKAFQARGISCPEVQIDDLYGEISVAVCGNYNPKAMCAVLKDALGRRYVLKDKLAYDGQKTCLVFTPPPRLDAAFGVAYALKKGEKVSGDTHSVIRINEHSFLMALSDGMGSGVYARKVSEAAISLIEAFYRAEMPADTVMNTINKLLSFNREERFACIDIAAVNLETGRADFVKIGSPAGIIMHGSEIKVLESNSLPLGILDNLKPAVCTETLKSGDLVVFMSDGITSAFPSATDLYEFLQGLKPLNPQSLADKILSGALDRSGRIPSDDMTVVCTRLFDNTSE